MFSVICNDFDVLDMELIDLAVQTLKEGNSLIIAGNGGQGKTSLMMRIAVNMALSCHTLRIIWISVDVVVDGELEDFWSHFCEQDEYLVCIDSPFYNEKGLKKLKQTFPAQLKGKITFLFAERIQRIEELLEEEGSFFARRYQEAEEVFIKGLEKAPENMAIKNELGRLYVEQKRYEEAEHIFLEGLKYELNEYFLVSLVELYQRMRESQRIDILMKNYTNKKTAYFSKYCKKCYHYLLNAKGLKEALKYKKRLQQLNSKICF